MQFEITIENLFDKLSTQIANAVMDLCADVLPEYVDDSNGVDLVGRGILWQIGMIAWNIAVTGRKEIDDAFVKRMKLDVESQNMVRNEVNALVRLKYEKYPELRTVISNVSAIIAGGEAKLKVSLGNTFPEIPIPNFDNRPNALTPEEILAKRKELGMTQVQFAAVIGISVKKVSAWEHGKSMPTSEELAKIRTILLE